MRAVVCCSHPPGKSLTNSGLRRRLRGILRGRQGSAIIEMAFGIPILFLILSATFWFTIALDQKVQLAEAVSVGGRFLAIDRGDTDPCAATATKIYNAAPGLTKSSIGLTFTLNGVATGASCPGSSGLANANMVSGANAIISASYPCTLTFFSAYGSSPTNTCNINATVEEVIQ
jgi:Flp pilus assembly protein TadG